MSREVQVRFCERVGVNYFSLLLYSTKSPCYFGEKKVVVPTLKATNVHLKYPEGI